MSRLDPRSFVGRLRTELINARNVGELVVTRGVAELRSRLADPVSVEETIQVATVEHARLHPEPEPEPEPAAPQAPDVSALALPDYDTLPAIDIVAQLDDLSPSERGEIARYERAHRRRRTVLGKIARLDVDA